MTYPTDMRAPLKKTTAPLGLLSSPSSTSSGQYKSSTPKAVPQAQPGTIQRAGTAAAPAAADKKPRPNKPKGKINKGKGKTGIPSIDKYLAGDTTYNDQVSQLQKQLEEFRNSNTGQQGMVDQDFQTALDRMTKQRESDLGNLQNDYAARGLLNSGLYTDAVGKYDTQYQSQLGDLSTGKQRSLSDLLEALGSYQTENAAGLTAAKQDAIRRRAQKYGITTA